MDDNNIELDFDEVISPGAEDIQASPQDTDGDPEAVGESSAASIGIAGLPEGVSLEDLVGDDRRESHFNVPTDVVIEDWASFYRRTTKVYLKSSCFKMGCIFQYVFDFLIKNNRNLGGCWHLPAQRFAKQLTYERFAKDANKIYNAAKEDGVKLPQINKRAAISLICDHLDYHMRDVDLSQSEINAIVSRSPVLKRMRNSINADMRDPWLVDYSLHTKDSPSIFPRTDKPFGRYCPEFRGSKPKDHRKGKGQQQGRPHTR